MTFENAPERTEITFNLTQENINAGEPSECSHCPYALAIGDHFASLGYQEVQAYVNNNYVEVDVFYDDANDADHREFYIVTQEMRDDIANFDEGKGIQPIERTLKRYTWQKLIKVLNLKGGYS